MALSPLSSHQLKKHAWNLLFFFLHLDLYGAIFQSCFTNHIFWLSSDAEHVTISQLQFQFSPLYPVLFTIFNIGQEESTKQIDGWIELKLANYRLNCNEKNNSNVCKLENKISYPLHRKILKT